ELAYGTASPNGYDVPRLDVAVLSPHVAGWEDVGQEQNLLIGEAFRNFNRADIREWHTCKLCLPASVAAHHVRIAKQARRGIPEHFFCDPRVRVGVVAQGPELSLAEEAFAAGDGEGNHHAISTLQVLDPPADLFDRAHELVAQYVARFHRRNKA